MDLSTIRAREFAIERHGEQRYGRKHPYVWHLDGVHGLLVEHGVTDLDVLNTAYTHDLLEDTSTTYNELLSLFGPRVAIMTFACSGVGNGSRRRHMDAIYARLATYPEACVPKIADRLFNVELAVAERSVRFCSRYALESDDFELAVKDHVPADMFERLQIAHDEAHAIARQLNTSLRL